MSKLKYQKALELVQKIDDFDPFKEPSQILIRKAEKELGFEITGQYLDYVKKFGTESHNGFEIYGFTTDNFTNASVPNGIWLTLQERKDSNLPKNLLIISDTGSGGYVCLNYADKEPKVVIFEDGVIEDYFEDFGSYLYYTVMEE